MTAAIYLPPCQEPPRCRSEQKLCSPRRDGGRSQAGSGSAPGAAQPSAGLSPRRRAGGGLRGAGAALGSSPGSQAPGAALVQRQVPLALGPASGHTTARCQAPAPLSQPAVTSPTRSPWWGRAWRGGGAAVGHGFTCPRGWDEATRVVRTYLRDTLGSALGGRRRGGLQ